MKKLFFIIFAIFTITLSSCGKDEGEELTTNLPATSSQEIQGKWQLERNAYYYRFTFLGSNYYLEVTNALNENPILEEYGAFTMDGNVITLEPFEGTTIYSPLEAYWKNSDRTVLNLSPLGSFNKL